ncbi:MAG TPA: ATP-dependent metallopeptidase FtsH/Yme1/Tma family protein, partial [Candidatus Methylomirabilis sp.]
MNPFFKNLALWLVIGLILVLIFNIFSTTPSNERELIFSDFWSRVERNEVVEVTIKGSEIRGK